VGYLRGSGREIPVSVDVRRGPEGIIGGVACHATQDAPGKVNEQEEREASRASHVAQSSPDDTHGGDEHDEDVADVQHGVDRPDLVVVFHDSGGEKVRQAQEPRPTERETQEQGAWEESPSTPFCRSCWMKLKVLRMECFMVMPDRSGALQASCEEEIADERRVRLGHRSEMLSYVGSKVLNLSIVLLS
jgi:hypothetical protein